MKPKPSDKSSLNAGEDLDMLPHYDFRDGTRGKYASRYTEGSNVVVLAPDIAAIFPNSEAVNEALRTLVRLRDAKAETQR